MDSVANVVLAVATVALAFATFALVWATYKLARHTETLSDLTKQLVAIEEQRDRREEREKRRAEISRCLKLVEEIRKIKPEEFIAQLSQPGVVPEPLSTYLQELTLLRKHISDSDTVQCLKEIWVAVDSVKKGMGIGANGPEVARKFKILQERLDQSVIEWSNKLAA